MWSIQAESARNLYKSEITVSVWAKAKQKEKNKFNIYFACNDSRVQKCHILLTRWFNTNLNNSATNHNVIVAWPSGRTLAYRPSNPRSNHNMIDLSMRGFQDNISLGKTAVLWRARHLHLRLEPSHIRENVVREVFGIRRWGFEHTGLVQAIEKDKEKSI